MLMLFILWRTKKTNSGKAQPNTLLKVRKKRTGTIDSDVNASVLLPNLSKSITNPQELIQIVKSDPELVAKVLNLANSPFFGLRKIITDVNHAVIYLGVTQVKNIATQFAIAQSFEFASDEQKKAYDYLSRHTPIF